MAHVYVEQRERRGRGLTISAPGPDHALGGHAESPESGWVEASARRSPSNLQSPERGHVDNEGRLFTAKGRTLFLV